MAVEDIADAAAGYGMAGEVVDGNDVLAVIDAVERAAARGRKGEGSTLLEMKTFRMRGHEEASGTKYVPDELIASWREKDPVDRYRQQLLAGELTAAERDAQLGDRLGGPADALGAEGGRTGGHGRLGLRQRHLAAVVVDEHHPAPHRGEAVGGDPRRALGRACAGGGHRVDEVDVALAPVAGAVDALGERGVDATDRVREHPLRRRGRRPRALVVGREVHARGGLLAHALIL